MWDIWKLEVYVDVECGDVGDCDDYYFECIGLVCDEVCEWVEVFGCVVVE